MLRKTAILMTALLVLGLGDGSVYASAQDNSQSPPDAPAPSNRPTSPPASKDKTSSSKNSSDKTSIDAKNASKAPPADAGPPTAPDAGQAPKRPPTSADNPFPEDVSKKAAADARAAATAAPAAQTTPARPDGSSSRDGLDKLGLDDDSRKKLKLESPDGTGDVYNPKRAAEDVHVGRYYLQTGDIKGAYARFKDAATFDHEDVDAVYWLAEAARRLKLTQEAKQNYTLYLDAAPDGPNAKAARKALDELGR